MVRFLDSYSRRLVFHDIFVALGQIEFDSDHLLSFGYHQLPLPAGMAFLNEDAQNTVMLL